MQDRDEKRTSRRDFVRAGVAAALALPAAPALLAGALAGCGSGEPVAQPPAPKAGAPPPQAPPSPEPAPPPAVPAPAAPPPSASDSGVGLVTEIPAMAALVTALQYVARSEQPGRTCGSCQFYSATQPGRGSCQLFTQGLVEEAGWCGSWAKRVAAT